MLDEEERNGRDQYRIGKAHHNLATLLKNDQHFQTVSVQTGGYGVCWGEQLNLSDTEFYTCG